jgi:hypothetical protein
MRDIMTGSFSMASMSSIINTEVDYIRHNNWISDLREEYNHGVSLIEKKDLVEFKKDWNSRNPPLIKRSSPHSPRSNISNNISN